VSDELELLHFYILELPSVCNVRFGVENTMTLLFLLAQNRLNIRRTSPFQLMITRNVLRVSLSARVPPSITRDFIILLAIRMKIQILVRLREILN
jgi:hypothetical protein